MSQHPILDLAERKRQQGALKEAEDLVRSVLAREPSNVVALNSLGLIAHQTGRNAEAVEHLRHAILLAPNVALYHANLGEMYRVVGQLDLAVEEGKRAIELEPQAPGAWSNVGIALFLLNRLEEALVHLDRALAIDSNFSQAHNNRGNVLQRLGRFADAEAAYRQALKLQPDFALGWANLGNCLRDQKRVRDAESAFRNALRLAPSSTDTMDKLALLLGGAGRTDEALVLLRRALAIQPRSGAMQTHLAMILFLQRHLEDADAAAREALKLRPSDPEALNLLGRVAIDRGDPATAVEYFRHALSIKPGFAEAYNNLGNALAQIGALTEAETAYVKALELDPRMAPAYCNLADVRTFSADDVQLAAMQKLAAADDLSDSEKVQLDFALGKAYGDIKDYRWSFQHFKSANARRRKATAYDEEAVFGQFARIEVVFTPALIAARSGRGDPSAVPVFIVGMPRSGTTLLEQILASHPKVRATGEHLAFENAMKSVRDGPYPEIVPLLDDGALRRIGEAYAAALRAMGADAARVVDKQPANFLFAGLIHLALPNAIIIHTVRDPIDTCLSCFTKPFTAGHDYARELGELGRYYRRYAHLMAHWRAVLPPGRVLDVRYEDVVTDIEGQARRVVAHCGLDWDEKCLAFYENRRPVRTSATQVRRPIYADAVGRSKNYESYLGHLIAALE